MRLKSFVFTNLAVLALAEAFISMYRSSGVKFSFQWQNSTTDVFVSHGCHVCAPPKGTNMASPYKAL